MTSFTSKYQHIVDSQHVIELSFVSFETPPLFVERGFQKKRKKCKNVIVNEVMIFCIDLKV